MADSTGSLFNDDELFELPQTGVIKVSNNLIRGASTVKKKKILRGGKEVMISEATINDKKIEDTCIEIFQAKELSSRIDYEKLQSEALKVLEPKFYEYGLIIDSSKSKQRNTEIVDMQSIAIDSYIKKSVAATIPKEIRFPFKEFIKRTGIARIQGRFNEALKVLSESSSKLSHSWMEQSVLFEDNNGNKVAKQINELTQGSIIPKFRLRFNDKLKNILTPDEIKKLTIEKFIEMDIPNKASYVDEMIMITDPETIVNITGVGLFGGVFGKGYAKSERKNRNSFRYSMTFNFDLLIRSIIGIPHNKTMTEFTFDQLKDILGASSYKGWESFKKSVLLPVIQDESENTEIECEYKLVPSQKNWTHIKLIPSWKKTSMGFEAGKFGYDYLAYFMAVQHKYFQSNNLDESLEGFVVYVQSVIYSSSDEEILWGRTLSEWKEYGKRVYEVEKELTSMLSINNDILQDNSLIYDEKRMCLVKKNFREDDEVEVTLLDNLNMEIKTTKKNRTSYIKTPAYRVTDPITSLRYLNELIKKGNEGDMHIFDFIPFSFASIEGKWLEIDSLEKYQTYMDPIRTAVYKKKSSFFRFSTDEKKEAFMFCLENRRFRELDQRFLELMEKLSV